MTSSLRACLAAESWKRLWPDGKPTIRDGSHSPKMGKDKPPTYAEFSSMSFKVAKGYAKQALAILNHSPELLEDAKQGLAEARPRAPRAPRWLPGHRITRTSMPANAEYPPPCLARPRTFLPNPRPPSEWFLRFHCQAMPPAAWIRAFPVPQQRSTQRTVSYSLARAVRNPRISIARADLVCPNSFW